jgi:Apoptogenic protein 1
MLFNSWYFTFQAGGKVIPPPKVTKDVFGPPDPKSNLRLIRFYIPPNETKAEQDYRLKRMEVQAWNQKFWSDHNIEFALVGIIIKLVF